MFACSDLEVMEWDGLWGYMFLLSLHDLQKIKGN